MVTDDTIKLKDCPFCGGKANVGRSTTKMWWQIGCSTKDCIAYIGKSQLFDTQQDAADEWNRREDKWKDFTDDTMPDSDEAFLMSDGKTVYAAEMVWHSDVGEYYISGIPIRQIEGKKWRPFPEPYEKA